MEEFPDEVIESILKFANIASHPVCRSICSRWKAEIERLGLAVVIDDREKNLLGFIRNIVIKEAHVKYLSCKDSEWLTLCLDDVKTLIFSGYVNPDFVKTNLLKGTQWQNLRKLFFYGTSLISQPLTDPGNDIEQIPCSLPNLKELHLVVASGTTRQAMKQFLHGVETRQFSISEDYRTLFDDPDQYPGSYLAVILDERVEKNARFLLNCITGPNLKTLIFSLGSQSTFNYHHLFKFVTRHGTTLENLIFPSIVMDDDVTSKVREMSNKLLLVQPKLKSVYFSRVSRELTEGDIWTKFVMAQTHLEEIFLQFNKFFSATFCPFVTTILNNNFKSLRYATIKSTLHEDEEGCLELDMQLLSASTCLEVLRITQLQRGKKPVFYPVPTCFRSAHCRCDLITIPADPLLTSRLKNINRLPPTLKVFETSFSTTEEFDGVRFLKEMVNLEELKMTSIRRIGYMEPRSHALEFIRLARLHRLLNVFEIEFGFSESVVPDIGGSWAELRRDNDFGEPCLALNQIVSHASAPKTNPCWTVESVYFGGMYPENLLARRYDNGFEMENDPHFSYMRTYFDAIDKGLAPAFVETCQPFDIDHSQNSYKISGSPIEEKCWGFTRFPLRSISSSSADYHRIYNQCKVNQGMSQVVLLVNDKLCLEQMCESNTNISIKWRHSNDGETDTAAGGDVEDTGIAIASDIAVVETSDEEITDSVDALNEKDPEAEGSCGNSSISNITEAGIMLELNGEDATENSTPPLVVFNETSCFILSEAAKPLII